MFLRFAVILTVVFYCIAGQADPHPRDYDYDYDSGSTEPGQVTPEVEVKHEITSNEVRNNVTITKSNQWSSYMQSYVGKELFKRFESLPGVSNFKFIPGEHIVNEKYFDNDIIESTRDSALVFTVDGKSPYTLMFKAKEVLRRCRKSDSANLSEEELDKWNFSGFKISNNGPAWPCRMDSSVKVTGPIAIYGTLPGATPINTRLLLLDQVQFEWGIKTDYSKRNTLIQSKFTINGVDFPKALAKVVSWSIGDNFVTEALLENPTHNALVQVGRILKSTNEKILRGE